FTRSGDAAADARRQLMAAKDAAPQRLASVRAELQKPVDPVTPTVPPNGTLLELEQLSNAADEAAKGAAADLRAAEASLQQRSQRQPLLPQQIAVAREKLANLTTQLGIDDPTSALDEPALSQHLALLAERYALAQETAKLEAELSNYSGSEELLGALRDL